MRLTLVVAVLIVAATASFAQNSPQMQPATQIPPPTLNDVTPGTFIMPGGYPRMTPYPGTEQALRHQIAAMETGQPDYAAMAPRTADLLRSRMANLRPALVRQWGTLVSLKYKPLWGGQPGLDVYEATFEHTQVRWEISRPDGQGKITGIAFKTLT